MSYLAVLEILNFLQPILPVLIETVQQNLFSLPLSALSAYFCGRIINPSMVDPKYEQPFIGIFSLTPSNGDLLLSVLLLKVYR